MSPASYPACLAVSTPPLFRGLSKKLLPFCECGSCVLFPPKAQHLSPSLASVVVELLALTSRHCLAWLVSFPAFQCPAHFLSFSSCDSKSLLQLTRVPVRQPGFLPGLGDLIFLYCRTSRRTDLFTCQHPVQPTSCPQYYKQNLCNRTKKNQVDYIIPF